VRNEGAWVDEPAANLVPGDIVRLSLANVVPADLRIIAGVLLVDQSMAEKSGQTIPKNCCRTTIAERMVETPAELPFIGDQVVCLSHEPGRDLQDDCRRSPIF
jgi:magnesium-transporting ATPase (P-type)